MSGTLSSGPANRRLTMPARLRIHSSLVSTRAARSSLVTTLPGWYPPNDRTRAPGAGGYGVAENGGTEDVMRLPFSPGGPIPPDPPRYPGAPIPPDPPHAERRQLADRPCPGPRPPPANRRSPPAPAPGPPPRPPAPRPAPARPR